MNQLNFPLLSTIIFLPLLGAVVVALLPRENLRLTRGVAFIVALADFIISLGLYGWFFADQAGMQFVERVAWIPDLGITYALGVDGISLWLVILTTLLTAVSVLFSFDEESRVKEFMAFMLVLETGMLGVFTALDLFTFFVFWEASLIPMYFLIGIFGGNEPKRMFGRDLPWRLYATIKFVLYTMAGSALMMIGILVLYFAHGLPTGDFTFDLVKLQQWAPANLDPTLQAWLFIAFGLAFAIKVPMWPFHTWLPDAHVAAPTAGSVILAGILLKMGTYGFVRFNLSLFPDAVHRFAPAIAILAIIGIIYGAMVAYVQRDIKSLVAYSSVSHLGFVMLGIFALNPQGLSGAVLQMVNHGLSTGALFLLVGMIYHRRHTRQIDQFGGLWTQLPVYAAFFMVAMLASVGLPGLNGFVGEFLILQGAWLQNPWYAVLAANGVWLAAVYLLWLYQRMFFKRLDNPANRVLPDLSRREVLVLAPIVVGIVLIGIFPQLFLGPMQASVTQLLTQVGGATASLR